MQKWRPLTVDAVNVWSMKYQIVVLPRYRSHILHLGHTTPIAGHLGVRKKITTNSCDILSGPV